MSDLIDRQAAIKAVLGLENCYNGFSDTYDKAHIVGLLEELPKVDAERVIRCKNCENFTTGKDEWGNCCENPMKMWRETDFCSWAERRTDED